MGPTESLAQWGPWLSKTVGSWRPDLLQHHWGRDWQPPWAVNSVGGALWGWVETVRANSALRDNLRVDFVFPLSLVLYGTWRLALLSKKMHCVDRNYYIPQFYVYYVNIFKKEQLSLSKISQNSTVDLIFLEYVCQIQLFGMELSG